MITTIVAVADAIAGDLGEVEVEADVGAKIPVPILRAIAEGHRELRWVDARFRIELYAETATFECGTSRWRMVWSTRDPAHAYKMAVAIRDKFEIDTTAQLFREVAGLGGAA